MAGRTLTVDMGEDDLLPAWRTVIEVSATDLAADWTLIGGLMVAAHAHRAGVIMRRPTDDVDVIVDYATNRASLAAARATLGALGFTLDRGSRFAYRFTHVDGRKIDVMVADHLPSRLTPRLDRRPAFAVDAGEQAIRRRDTYALSFGDGTQATVGVTDELGALVAKGAAYIVDTRDRERHLDDTVVLLACVADVSALALDTVNHSDRKRIKATTDILTDDAHAAWTNLSAAGIHVARINLALIRQAMRLAL